MPVPKWLAVAAFAVTLIAAGCGQAGNTGASSGYVTVTNWQNLPAPLDQLGLLPVYDSWDNEDSFLSQAEDDCDRMNYVDSYHIPGQMRFANGPAGSVNVAWRMQCPGGPYWADLKRGWIAIDFRVSQDGSSMTALNNAAQEIMYGQ